MDLGLRGRAALVLGSSSGLGRAVAASLVAEGARVAIVSRSSVRSEQTAAEVGAVAALVCDLTVPGEPTRLVANAVAALGGLDVCVVNTGGGRPGPILDTADADDAAYHAMLRPVLELSRAVSPHIVVGDHGRLIYLTARSVLEASPELALSSVFRSGVAAAARSLALELAPRATVNVIVTGQFDTPALGRFEQSLAERESVSIEEIRRYHIAAIPMRRIGRAEELADVVTFLASDRASFVTGTVIRVDGGAVRAF